MRDAMLTTASPRAKKRKTKAEDNLKESSLMTRMVREWRKEKRIWSTALTLKNSRLIYKQSIRDSSNVIGSTLPNGSWTRTAVTHSESSSKSWRPKWRRIHKGTRFWIPLPKNPTKLPSQNTRVSWKNLKKKLKKRKLRLWKSMTNALSKSKIWKKRWIKAFLNSKR